ncbi:DUF317 domain-containing protein [Streptomyces sp. NPDC047803]|uniref:DUF317 domain-containing protein n=1 Tax=Streptomyces sp. NPDC047803 TaxID=3160976 RepID=UPI0033BFE390
MLPDPPLDPFNNFGPDQEVKVLPRHLAGPGERDLCEIWPFPFDSGWRLHPAEDGMTFSSSPCARVWTRLVLEPDTRGQGMWTIGASRIPFGPTSWQIVFDVTTPAELLHDVPAELRDRYLWDRSNDRAYLFNDETAPHTAYAPLFAGGWSHEANVQGTQTFRSPDGLGAVRYRFAPGTLRGPNDPAWTAWAGDWGTPQWKARFARNTPATLVAAFTTSLISTEPLHRTLKDVPLDFRHRLNTTAATAHQPPARPPAAPPPTGPAPRRTQ